MKYLKLVTVLVAAFICGNAVAQSFGSVSAEKTKLLKRIQCARDSTTPPSDGFGALWGCYNREEDVKLWINSKSSNREAMKNLKFVVVNWHGKKMDITGRIWSGIVAEEYGGSHAEEIKKAFQSCPVNQSFNNGQLDVLVKCSKGPRADEHMILVTLK